MPTLTYLGDSFDCTTAIKGADYIHLLDENGQMLASFDGISDFSPFTLTDGEYTEPTADHDCYLAVIRDDGTIGKGGHRCSDLEELGGADIEEVLAALPETTELDFSNWDNGSFEETLGDGTTVTHTVTFDDNDDPVSIDGITIAWE